MVRHSMAELSQFLKPDPNSLAKTISVAVVVVVVSAATIVAEPEAAVLIVADMVAADNVVPGKHYRISKPKNHFVFEVVFLSSR